MRTGNNIADTCMRMFEISHLIQGVLEFVSYCSCLEYVCLSGGARIESR